MGGAVLRGDGLEVGRGEAGRMLEDRGRNFNDVACQPRDHGLGGRRVGGQPRGQGRPFRQVGGIDEPQCQLGVIMFIFGGVSRPLQIKMGEHAQQSRAHVDFAPGIEQIFEFGQGLGRLRH